MWLNALLAAAVAALGAFIYLRPARVGPAEYPLSTLKASEAKSIRIERAGAGPILLEKSEAGWTLAAPFAARADAARVERLLAIVEATATHKLPAVDLARFELERPDVRMTVNGRAFSFGMVNAVTREQYVLTGDSVYTVAPHYATALPAGAADAASRQLFGPAEAPSRIELRQFTVELRDGKWAVVPAAAGLSQDDVIQWVDEWRLAGALHVEPHAGTKAREEIRIQLRSGARFTLGVLAREPELVIARFDERLAYRFRAAAAQRLLSPPRSEAERRKP